MTNYEEILRLKNPDRSSMLLRTQRSRQARKRAPGAGLSRIRDISRRHGSCVLLNSLGELPVCFLKT
jgi:hypothetical protein